MSFFETRLYRSVYDLIRKNKLMNHWAHKVMQSERVHQNRAYQALYGRMLHRKAEGFFYRPPIIEFEVTNRCNARCTMCAPEVHSGNELLPVDLFEKIARQAIDLGIKRMIITGGEPLMDRSIIEKIEVAKKLGFTYVHMFTNGSLLPEGKQERLLTSGLDSLTVSVDSAVKEEFEKIRINLNFDKVVSNVQTIYRLKKQLGLNTPIVRVNMVALPENSNSRQLFIDTFKHHADIVEIMEAHNFAESMEIDKSTREYTQVSRYPCHLMFIKAVVTPSGFLKKCSIDYAPGARMADLKVTPLKEALENSRLAEIKKKHLDYTFTEPGCAHCDHIESWWIDC